MKSLLNNGHLPQTNGIDIDLQRELDRRLADYLANPNDVMPWYEVKAFALARIKQRSPDDIQPRMTITELIGEYLQCFRQGDSEMAFFGLLDIGCEALPELVLQFQQEQDNAIREFLVEVIWQYRQASAIPFLAERLYDPAPAIRRQALNGLVSLASPQVLEVLTVAKAHWRLQAKDTEAFADWLDEAIGQVESTQDNISIK